MSRVIKFRAWDKTRNQMYTNAKWVNFTASNGVIGAENYARGGGVQQLPIMQFTGLTDKNGADVYEGDIVNCWDWGAGSNKLICVSEVEWDDDAKGWGLTPDPTDGDRYDLFRNIEVIGNKHEQPELLEVRP